MIKKLFLLPSLILILSAFTFAQSKTNDAIEKQIKTLGVEKAVSLNYNEAGGTSKILAIGEDFGREQNERFGLQGFSFGMASFYAGKTLNAAPATINLTFWAQSKKPKFAESHSLIIFADGKTLDLGEARYVAKRDKNMEYLNFIISRENFIKIAASEDAKLKIGTAEFKFTPEHLRILKALAKISNPSDL